MPSPDDIPDLDALVRVIESLQERISRDYETIAPNEIRTRTALVDPLLNALGWDTADPAMVIPEYAAGGGVADYALLKTVPDDGPQVIAFIEAKRLNEDLRPHRPQMLNYANMVGVRYAGLTNGDRWELYEVFKEAPLDQRRIVDVSISRESALECAVKLLPLKWPHPETGVALSPQGTQSIFIYVIRAGAGPSVIALLIDKGASLEAWNDDGMTPLHFAAQVSADPQVIEALLDHGADIVGTTNRGWTPLHLAASRNSNPEVAALLLDRGADIGATDNDGLTPVHLAAGDNSNPDVAALLLDRGADIGATFGRGWVPLHLAAEEARPEVVELLLDRGADIEATDSDGLTPLHWAARINSNPEVTALLLNRNADVKAVTAHGETPLHIAAGTARPEIVEILLKYGADPLALTDGGRTAYQIAKGRGADEEILELLRSPCFLDPEFWESCTPEEVEAELNRGADVMAENENAKTPLHLAVESASLEVIALLLDSGADIAAIDENDWSPLHVASAQREDSELVDLLLDYGADIEGADSDGWTPLHLAARYNSNPEVVALLLDHGADTDAVTGSGETLCQLAGSMRVLWLLREPDENLSHEDFWRNADAADVRSQLNRGADLALRTDEGASILHLAARWNSDPFAVAALLDGGANIEARDSDGWTPLHKAALNEEPPSRQLSLIPDPAIGDTVVETLLKHGADRYALTDDGRTAYQIAKARVADKETLMSLSPWSSRDLHNPDFWRSADAIDVQIQLKRGAELNRRDRDGNTPLHKAASFSNDPAVIKVLMDNGANPRALTHGPALAWTTPYGIAKRRGVSEEILQLLRW